MARPSSGPQISGWPTRRRVSTAEAQEDEHVGWATEMRAKLLLLRASGRALDQLEA
jgi:hypothetical protein